MNQQVELFYETILEALRAAIHAAGGAKVVAAKLWPKKSVADAHRELLDALNAERPRKLDPEEVLFVLALAREAGFHNALHFICDRLGYAKPAPVDPADQAEQLQREFIAAVARSERVLEEMKRVAATPPLRSVAKNS
jgi:hypothetical protein